MIVIVSALSLFSISSQVHARNETNLALNPAPETNLFPSVSASYTCGCDRVWSIVNGVISYTDDPRDRWTNYGSGNEKDWLAIDFGSARTFNQAKLYVFDDGGGVQPSADYLIQYWDDSSGWMNLTNPIRTPAIPEAFLNTVNFDAVTSCKLKIVFTNNNAYVGLVELEVFLHHTEEEEQAITDVMTRIEHLPSQAEVVLSDKPAITAARAAYELLAASQKKGFVTNLSRLTAAEEAIIALEAVTPPEGIDVAILSAFGDAAGHTITIKVSSVLDITYGIQADKFMVTEDETPVSVMNAVYDVTDSSHQTIKLTFSSPVLSNAASVHLSIQSGAFKSSNNEFNHAVPWRPVITFNNLDLTLDHRIGIDDIVQIIIHPSRLFDVNQDGMFTKEDISDLLKQISPSFN
ncbi:discoidin domain-containing protein [Paenibacillus ferrarius]|uniref:discoidin domain-containing protein n=1 Tax=Paenibacillus ferrarius TaxID=1469647 RepID=UPI001301D64C|nr:discoidin domain-containing protein [Paenibacillus ferrarius]